MRIKDVDIKKKPIVVIDPKLDFYNDKILFPKKLEEANSMLKNVGLPNMGKQNNSKTA